MITNQLIGVNIILKTGLKGKIAEIDRSYILTTMEDGKNKRFGADAFEKGYLIFQDIEKQDLLKKELNEQKSKAEVETAKKAEEARIAEEKLKEDRKRIEEAEKLNKELFAHEYLKLKRGSGKPAIFLVCQKNNFEIESRGSYLWAPNDSNKASHKEMKFVKFGDIIIHHYNNTIWAVSVVKNDCYVGDAPSGDIRGIGYIVEAKYNVLSNPASTVSLKEDKIKYGNYVYSPFDKNGKNNQGVYLTEVQDNLAKLLFKEAIKANPSDSDLKAMAESIYPYLVNK